jgi:hypothetical protein
MRTLLLVAVVVAAFVAMAAGCRTQPLDQPIGSQDFGTTVPPVDMSVRFVDLSVPNGSGCNDLLNCINNCPTQQCQTQCFNDAPPDAQNLLTQALNCIYGWCQEREGTRPPRCDINFMDEPDAGDGTCNQCLTNAYASLGGYECMPSNDPDCDPPKCQMLVNACLQQ